MKPVALVTASSKGIGAACARRLHEDGFSICLIARSSMVFEVAQQLPGSIGITADITNTDQDGCAVLQCIETFGRMDVLVNNSGHIAKKPLMENSDSDWQAAFETYLLSVTRMTRLALPHLQKSNRGGSVVNISSFSANTPSSDFALSSIIRAGLEPYARLFAREHGHQGLRMNNVLPGFVDSYPENSETIKHIPANRYATTMEIANLVAFLVSDQAKYINGREFTIDGGLTA